MARTTLEATTELGKHLEAAREKREFTKDAWCTELEISRPTYDRWLTRPSPNMDFNNIRKIAIVVGVTIDTVFGWIDVDVPIIHVIPWFGRPIDAQAESLIPLAA